MFNPYLPPTPETASPMPLWAAIAVIVGSILTVAILAAIL